MQEPRVVAQKVREPRQKQPTKKIESVLKMAMKEAKQNINQNKLNENQSSMQVKQ